MKKINKKKIKENTETYINIYIMKNWAIKITNKSENYTQQINSRKCLNYDEYETQ